MQHLDEGTIHAWLDGALSADEALGVERHAAECASCASMVAEARGLIAGASRIVSALDVTRGGVIPNRPAGSSGRAGSVSVWQRLRFTPARAAIAATLIVAVGSMLTVRNAADERGTMAPAADKLVMQPAVVNVAAPTPAAAPPVQARTVSAPASRPAASKADVAEGTRPARELAGSTLDALKKTAAPQEAARQPEARDVAAAPPVSRVADSVVSAERARAAMGGGARGGGRGGRGVNDRVLQLQEAVVTSAATGRVDSARVDSARRATANAPAGLAAGGAFASARRERAGTPTVVVCYSIASPLPAWASHIPPRFALDPMRASDTSATRLVIRRVTAEGKTDGPIPGSWWQPLGADTLPVLMTWADGASRAPVTLTVTLDAPSRRLIATLRESVRTEPVSLSFAPCQP
jgi:hypothetical protein